MNDEDTKALLEKGWSVDQIVAAAQAPGDSAANFGPDSPYGPRPPGEKKFRTMGRQALSVLPTLAAGAASAPFFPELAGAKGLSMLMKMASIPAAGLGGAAGKAAELGIAKEPITSEALTSEGMHQALIQGIPAGLSVAGQGLTGLRDFARNFEINKEIKASRKLSMAGDIRGDIHLASNAAQAARAQAGLAVSNALKSAGTERITVKDIIDQVTELTKQGSPTGTVVNPGKLAKDIRLRLGEIISGNEVLRAQINPNKIVFSPVEAQLLKKEFGRTQRGAFTQLAGGVEPRPALDRMINSAFKTRIEAKVPGVKELNATSQDALLKARALQKLELRQPTDEVLALKQTQNESRIKEQVLASRTGNPFTLFAGVPMRGGPTLAPRIAPGHMAEMGGYIGSALNHPLGLWASMLLPRLLAGTKAFNEDH